MPINVETFDPLSTEITEHYWDHLAELRECPVGKTDLYGGMWLFSRYRDVMTIVRDWQTYSSTRGSSPVPLSTHGDVKPIPIALDPPIQREYRRLMDRYFSPRSIAGSEGLIRQIVIALIERFQERGHCDFVAEFAVRLPQETLFRLAFGVQPAQMDDIERVMGYVETIQLSPDRSAEALASFFDWAHTLLERRRKEGPKGDVLDALLDGTVAGRPLTDSERQMVIMNLVIGGVETTVHALGNVMIHLATQPSLCDRLDRERELIPAAVEEFLRLEAPAPALGRYATCPTELGGAQIEPSDWVAFYIGAANRDPEVYENPSELDVERFSAGAQPHLTFGAGPHRCPGAHLARMELRLMIEEVLDRLDDLALATDQVHYRSGLARGPIELPISFTSRATAV